MVTCALCPAFFFFFYLLVVSLLSSTAFQGDTRIMQIHMTLAVSYSLWSVNPLFCVFP